MTLFFKRFRVSEAERRLLTFAPTAGDAARVLADQLA
jgi:hypothetical protein